MQNADSPPAVRTALGPAPVGRREANKIATRQALQQAADRLFAERGVAQTTVRDIADEAGVTERTFFRYFGSKEDLIIRDAFDWIPVLQQVILDRPATEPPLVAVRRALETLIGSITRSDTASPLTLFAGGPPGERVSPSALRIMRKVEIDVADVLEQRLRASAAASTVRSTRVLRPKCWPGPQPPRSAAPCCGTPSYAAMTILTVPPSSSCSGRHSTH